MIKRRIEIVTSTNSTLTVRRAGLRISAWCAGCGAATIRMTPDEAAAEVSVNARAIYRWLEAGRLHFTEIPGGSVMICENSLRAIRSV
jgi:excisionase family DNA binding protein